MASSSRMENEPLLLQSNDSYSAVSHQQQQQEQQQYQAGGHNMPLNEFSPVSVPTSAQPPMIAVLPPTLYDVPLMHTTSHVQYRISRHGACCCPQPARDFIVGTSAIRVFKEFVLSTTSMNTGAFVNAWYEANRSACSCADSPVAFEVLNEMLAIRREDIVQVNSRDSMLVAATTNHVPTVEKITEKTIPVTMTFRTKDTPTMVYLAPHQVEILSHWVMLDRERLQSVQPGAHAPMMTTN